VTPARPPWRSPRRRGRLVWAAHLALLACLVALAALAHGRRADPPDLWLTETLQGQHWLDAPLRAVSWIGSWPQELAIYGALVLALAIRRGLRAASTLVGAVLGATALYWAVKALVRRPRPAGPHVHVLGHLGTYSFPSGHVVTYVACYGFLAYLAWTTMRRGALRVAAVAICLALVALIGLSRIYLGEHWASDVLGGYLLGGIWLSLVLRAYVASAGPSGAGPHRQEGDASPRPLEADRGARAGA
jgi:membrane-associated phospholipid phosphatase